MSNKVCLPTMPQQAAGNRTDDYEGLAEGIESQRRVRHPTNFRTSPLKEAATTSKLGGIALLQKACLNSVTATA